VAYPAILRDQYADIIGRYVLDASSRKIYEVLDNVSVSVYTVDVNGARSALATIYTSRTGGVKTNPFLTVDGIVEFWAEPGDYDIEFIDQNVPVRLTTKSIGWEALPGGPSGVSANQLPGAGSGLLPAGSIIAYGGAAAPSAGYLLCDGTIYTRTTYPALFNVIGTTYNSGGETASQFRVPDLRGRVAVGVDGTAARLSASDAMGNSGGVETVTLTSTQSGVAAHGHAHTIGISDPSHSHLVQRGGFDAAAGGAVGGGISQNSGTNLGTTQGALTGITITGAITNHAGASAAASHTNLQPYQIVNYIIKT
jgi:microcystin-dependent protein